MLLHIIGVDLDGFAVAVRRGEGNVVQHPLHHRLQPPRADVLHRGIDGDCDVGKRIYGAMKEGELDGLSIGFKVGKVTYSQKAGEARRTIYDFKKLPEISLVTSPMDLDARSFNVKSAAGVKTIREFEDFLRDVGGYSHSAAKAIAAGGFKANPEPRDEDDGELVDQIRRNINILKG